LGLGGEAAFIREAKTDGECGVRVIVIGTTAAPSAELRAPTRGDAALACFPRAVIAPAPVASLVLGGDVRVSSSRASIDLFELVF